MAGGCGRRMGSTLPKQFMLLDGQPVLARTINRFAQALPGAPLVVVLPEEHKAFWRDLAARFDVARHTVATGGAERFHSVSRGLEALPPDVELIAVHDGVRPLLSAELIRRTVAVAAEYGTAVPAVAPVDSFRSTEGVASHPVDRSMLRAVQTPQVFRARLLRDAYETLFSPDFTDDASVVERFGATIRLCDGERRNIKITAREDLLFAEALLADDADRAAAEAACPRDEAAMSDRTEAGIPAGRDAAAPEAAK